MNDEDDEVVMYHWFDGWFFGRLPDGSVRIEKRQHSYRYSPIMLAATIPPDEWASIVTFVSQYGDNAEYWQQAREFHGAEE